MVTPTVGGLPDQIPPQGAPFVYLDGEGHYRLETDWYLFLYFVGTQIAAVQNGGSPLPPAVNIAFADIDSLGADIAKVATAAQNALTLAQDSLLQDASTGTGGGITALTNDVIASGTGSVSAALNLAKSHAWTATQYVTNTNLTDASSITPNVSTTTNNFYLLTTTAVGSSRTINLPTGVQPGMVVNIQVKQPSSGGPCAIVWAAGYLWGQGGGSAAPIPSQAANAVELYSFIVQQDLNLHGVMIGQSGPAGAGYGGTSSTSQGTGTGSKTFAIQAGLAWQVGAYVRFTSSSTGEYMQGTVTAYALASMTINVDVNTCTTSHTDWLVNATGVAGPAGSQGIQGPAGTGNGVNLQTGTSYTVVSGDLGKLISFSNASPVAVAVPQATGSFASPAQFDVENRGAGTVTLTPATSAVDGAATLVLQTNQGCRWFSDSTNWYTQRGIGGGATGAQHAFKAYGSGNLTVTASTFTKVPLNTTLFDTDSAFNTTNSRYQPTVAGYYTITGQVYASGSATRLLPAIYKNGALYAYGTDLSTTIYGALVSDTVYLNGSTDYVELWAYSTTTPLTGGSSVQTFLSGRL